jgi:hypothetical protein
MQITVFWDIRPCSLINRYQHFEKLVTSIFQPDEGGRIFSKCLVTILHTTRCHIPEDDTLHALRRGNLTLRITVGCTYSNHLFLKRQELPQEACIDKIYCYFIAIKWLSLMRV